MKRILGLLLCLPLMASGQALLNNAKLVNFTSGAISRGGGGGGGGTDPSTLGAVVLYDPTKQSPTVGQVVNLTDFSGNHFDAKKSGNPYLTNSTSPVELNSTNFWGVACPGGGAHVWSTNFTAQSQPVTVYAAARPRAPTGSVQYLFDSASSTRVLFTLNNPTPTLSAGSNITGGNNLATRWYWFEFQVNGASSFCRTNDVVLISTANAGTSAMNGLTLGENQTGSNLGQWDIAYFQVVPSSVAAGTSSAVYQWATNRFGTQLQ